MTNKELLEAWTAKFKNDLPDSSFLYIEKGGKKDKEGKTVPRNLRHLPYKDNEGNIDLPHLRNALARIPVSDFLSDAQKKALTAKAQKILNNANKSDEGLNDDPTVLYEAKWDAAYNEELPDDHFLYVPEDAESDALGNAPKEERYWPYIDDQGETDTDQLKKAIEEIPNTQLPIQTKEMLVAHAQSLLNAITLTNANNGTDIETLDQNVHNSSTLRATINMGAGYMNAESNNTEGKNVVTEKKTETAEETKDTAATTTEQTETKVEENNVLNEQLTKVSAELNETKAAVSSLTEENKKLKKDRKTVVENYASLSALLGAVKTALVAELGDNDWDDASWLADFGECAQWRMADDAVDALGVDDDDGDEAAEEGPIGENLKNSIAVIESLQTFIPEFLHQVRDNKIKSYISEKTREEKFGRAVATKLEEANFTSKKDVDEAYDGVLAQVRREMNNVPGAATTGTVNEDSKPKYTKEQLAQRRLVPGLEPYI